LLAVKAKISTHLDDANQGSSRTNANTSLVGFPRTSVLSLLQVAYSSFKDILTAIV
jgi:hypothetical protein